MGHWEPKFSLRNLQPRKTGGLLRKVIFLPRTTTPSLPSQGFGRTLSAGRIRQDAFGRTISSPLCSHQSPLTSHPAPTQRKAPLLTHLIAMVCLIRHALYLQIGANNQAFCFVSVFILRTWIKTDRGKGPTLNKQREGHSG